MRIFDIKVVLADEAVRVVWHVKVVNVAGAGHERLSKFPREEE